MALYARTLSSEVSKNSSLFTLTDTLNDIGTRYFDDDWLFSGTGDRKETHFNDLIDSAIFIKENELAPKLAICATNPSGSLTALTSVFKEPYLFEGVAVQNPLTDISNHLLHDI